VEQLKRKGIKWGKQEYAQFLCLKESNEMNLAMQRAQEKVLQMQSRANAIDALLDSGSLGDQGLLSGGQASDLDHQLAQISSHNVDEELATMRKQIGN
jgi:phage shock protein A